MRMLPTKVRTTPSPNTNGRLTKQPGDRILHYNFGLFLFDYDRDASAEQLRMAQPWDGFPVFAPDGTQLE